MIGYSLKRWLAASVCCLAALANTPASAEDRYISDELRVPLRSGMGNQYRIVHRGLVSGTRLELLQSATDDNETPWSLVKTSGGLEGWIRTQYLLEEPTAAIKLANLQNKMAKLDGNQSQLLESNDALEEENKSLKEQLQQLSELYSETERNYKELQKLSANAVSLNQQHKKLSENYQLLQTRADVLQTENERLLNNNTYRQWIYGAGILIAGIIVSFVLQLLGRRKRRSEWG